MDKKLHCKSTEYLYDMPAVSFSDMRYKVAVEYKIEKAKELLDHLLDVPFEQRDDSRVLAVHKAIKFNEALLEELEE
jgi:hypothetical protein